MASQVYFVENLTLRMWVWSVWPRLLWSRLRTGRRVTQCYVIDGLRLVILFARVSAGILAVPVEKLAFRLVDVRDEAGLLIRLRIPCQDLAEVQRYAMAEPVFQQLVQRKPLPDRLPMFLAKNMAINSQYDPGNIWRALYLIQVCVWKEGEGKLRNRVPVLFLGCRPWLKAIVSYASKYDVTIIPVSRSVDIRAVLRRRLPPGTIDGLRALRYEWSRGGWSAFRRKVLSTLMTTSTNGPVAPLVEPGNGAQDARLRVAVEYYGQLNLSRPECHSDLFFWQKSSLPGRDVLVTFAHPADPLDEQKWAELMQHGIGAVVLHPGAITTPGAPVFNHRTGRNPTARDSLLIARNGITGEWLKEQIVKYQTLRAYWTDLFSAYGVKVYVTWYKNDGTHCAIADALQSLGGITAIYQRSYESHPSPETTTNADIVFGFAQAGVEVERRSNSSIRYHVTTGYLGDHRFALLSSGAQKLRDKLERQGANRILAFSDENSTDDSRWHTGHHFMRENYAFLLGKVLAEPWFGLVIKPKTPRTLRRRLGPIAEMLEQAEATGRCYVYQGGAMHGWHPPAAAALAADVAVHGHLCAATAGMEAALAGIPTLLLDREGWSASPLYRLGVGRVVFKEWQTLWEALVEHWARPEGVPGFGDWSPMLNELDPFRDGRAAERMGTYIQWLIEGFKAGLDREAVMANAAERYCAAWGRDKVTEVNTMYSSPYVVRG